MSKYFDIAMGGLISGIVALTTTVLGLGGTILGSVLGAIIYQVLSIFLKEPFENTNIRKIENEIVYILPLILIAIILVVFIMAYFNGEFFIYYYQLKEFTDNNLLRLTGLSLIAMGFYPLLPISRSRLINRNYGIDILILGVILTIRGLIDLDYGVYTFYTASFHQLDIVILLCILISLLFVIFTILSESVALYNKKDDIELSKPHSNHDNKKLENNLESADDLDAKPKSSFKTSTMSKSCSFGNYNYSYNASNNSSHGIDKKKTSHNKFNEDIDDIK